ncbi:twin-arginine translocase TatA/TatE family subunit [bacterium]|nr:twin-arginine translocase TatA/TatE family subunit [bacterium]
MPFNIGPGELIFLVIVALLIFGPKKLPELGKALGESIGLFKKALNGEDTKNSAPPLPPAAPDIKDPEVLAKETEK